MSEGLSFIVSLLSDIVPAIKEQVERNKILSDKIDDCLSRAIDKWSAPEPLKQSTRLEPIRYKVQLKEFILHPQKGIHPLDKELLQLWADAIMADGDCSSLVLSLKEDLIHATQQERFQNVLSGLDALSAEQHDIKHKVYELWNRGGRSVNQLWDEVSVFNHGNRLPYSIITSGRDSIAHEIKNACSKADYVVFEAQSRLEAKAFAAAVILENSISSDDVIVVECEELYHQLVNDKNRKVIITCIPANHQLTVSKGHSVIYCLGPQDNYAEAHTVLPEINRDGFIAALKTMGLTDDKARRLALDSAKDINILWRLLGINQMSPSWETIESIEKFIPLMLVGRWDETGDDDKQLVAEFAGYKSYDFFRKELNNFIFADESPLKRIETVFAIKSPYAVFKRYFRYVTDADIQRFLGYVDLMMDDVDPDAVAKMNAEELRYWHEKRVYSANLRRGMIEGVTLISLMQEDLLQENIIENWIGKKFASFDLQKYLSHRHNLEWMAEAAPKAFLDFLENDIKKGAPILNELFIIRTGHFSLVGTEIYYPELLRCLECIAWSEDYLPQVTRLLLHMSAYPNNSNWANRPSESLKNIYRFVLPGTLASMPKRLAILKGVQSSYPKAVHSLCFDWLKGLHDTVWHPTSYFRWRWSAQKPEMPKNVVIYPDETLLHEIYELMMLDFRWAPQEVVELIKLSMYGYMYSLRDSIIATMRMHIDDIRGNDTICEELRHEIYHHMNYPDALWALKSAELQKYKDLLQDITLQDIINANKHFFDNIFMNDPEVGIDYHTENQVDEAQKYRAKIENKIIAEKGLDGIWELAKVAKSSEAVAGGFAELTGDKHRIAVYERYCNGELSAGFVKHYFTILYYKFKDEKDVYLRYIEEMTEINPNKIAVVLYAPGFYRELADMAEQQSDLICLEYWQHVQRSGVYEDKDVPFIIERLIRYKRYDDALLFISSKEVLPVISSKQKVDALYTIFQSEGIVEMAREAYQVGHILETVEIDGNKDIEVKVEQMEFYLYDRLEYYLKGEHNHFRKAINTKPELMMEIVSAIFKPNIDMEEDISDDARENKEFMVHIAYDFWFKYQDVPCTGADGSIDGNQLRAYLNRIKELAVESHRENVIPIVIGKILGNFPEDDDYPSQLLCDLVEEYSEDNIDTEIGCTIHNRRSFSTRSPFEGGTVERNHIETLKKYRDRAMARSLRFVRIIDSTIKSFENSAKRNDFEGEMNNFDF